MTREYRFLAYRTPAGRAPISDEGELWPEADLQRAADRIVLARFGPPALVVDETHERRAIARADQPADPAYARCAVSWNLGRVLRVDIVK